MSMHTVRRSEKDRRADEDAWKKESEIEGQEAGPMPLDAASGSFLLPGLEVIIGDDDRKQVTKTQDTPWRRICSLRIHAQDGILYIGTGWFISPRVVATAGHCVFMRHKGDEGQWAEYIEVTPGQDGDHQPYGRAISTRFRTVAGWQDHGDSRYDYGVIILPEDEAIGQQTGWFGFANYTDSVLESMTANLAGYPAIRGGEDLMFMARRFRRVKPERLTYKIDTQGGQSGSPVWRYRDGKRVAVGIHTNGASSGNSGTRINKQVFDNLMKWRKHSD